MDFKNVNRYKIFVGLNDKDTYKQIVDTNEAENRIQIIVSEMVGGATFSKSQGFWVDSFGNETRENTIEIMISNCNDDVIEEICIKLRDEFNQNCVMVEKSISQIAFV